MKKTTSSASYTQEELAVIIAQAVAIALKGVKAPAKAAKVVKTDEEKAAVKAAKAAAWKAEKVAFKDAANITEKTIAKYNAIRAKKFASDWAKWVASEERNALKGDARKEANRAHTVALENSYRLAAGMTQAACK